MKTNSQLSNFSLGFLSLIGASLFCLLHSTASAYWPPLQNVQAQQDGLIMRYSAFDTYRGIWIDGSTPLSGGSAILLATNGVVQWDEGELNYFAAYDPGRGSWRVGNGVSILPITHFFEMTHRDGVAAWTSDGLVRFATYNPDSGTWDQDMGSSLFPRIGACADGVIVWNDVFGPTSYAIFDPTRGWIKGETDWIGNSASYSIANATVTIITGGQTFTRGYNHKLGTWVDGRTVPFAYFAASAISGIGPTNIWFTDMSIGATSWNWNFGDGTSSVTRSPSHFYNTPGCYVVSLNVAGPNGVSTTNITVRLNQSVIPEPFSYTTINGMVIIYKYNGLQEAVSIPDTINGLPVNRIAPKTFYQNTCVTNVTIPDTVTSIDRYAFGNCFRLTSVRIGNNVSSIEDFAFDQCVSLTTIILPNSLTNIGILAFQSCFSLPSITIPGSVTAIGREVFNNCFALTAINVDPSNSFYAGVAGILFNRSHSKLIKYPQAKIGSSYTVPNSVTSIDDFAFSYCGNLTGIYFMGDPPTLGGSYVFNGANNATIYYLPGTTGWGPTYGGRPTALWRLPSAVILNHSTGFGVQTNGFGFAISWATNITVVVEGSTNLANPIWFPIQTNSLAGGSFYFTDPDWTNYPGRFYRVRSP